MHAHNQRAGTFETGMSVVVPVLADVSKKSMLPDVAISLASSSATTWDDGMIQESNR
jgi:hypothetical protein